MAAARWAWAGTELFTACPEAVALGGATMVTLVTLVTLLTIVVLFVTLPLPSEPLVVPLPICSVPVLMVVAPV